MTEVLERRRTGWDVVLGVLLVIGGIFLLANVLLATTVSVALLAWCALIGGIIMVVAGLVRIGSDFSWSVLLGGAALTVLGLFMLRNLGVTALALTLTAGALFCATGLARIVIAFSMTAGRWLVVLSGIISVILGLWILFNPDVSTVTLLGALLGIQVILEGVTLMVQGRLRLAPLEPSAPTGT
jgi:membrane protein HdeD